MGSDFDSTTASLSPFLAHFASAESPCSGQSFRHFVRRALLSRAVPGRILGHERIRRIEFGHTGVAPSDPAEHINRLGIGQPTGERVRNDFEQRVGSKIFVVVDIRFHKNTTESVDDLLVALVKCELYVCFSELNLFPACRGSRMKEGGIRLRGDLMLLCGDSYLVYKLRIT